ncbi:MAG TPA: hypothetical protein VFW96_09735 [Thermomicrobiales bacterium]|nr:hypothetical protein [Thermomicrobiales bacterium]
MSGAEVGSTPSAPPDTRHAALGVPSGHHAVTLPPDPARPNGGRAAGSPRRPAELAAYLREQIDG